MGELSEEERRFETGHDPRILDVVTIPMREHSPQGYQSENHLIDERYYWTRQRQATIQEARTMLSPISGALWINDPSSYHGENDRVLEANVAKLGDSLKLAEVDDFRIRVRAEGESWGDQKKKVRGFFSLNGIPYGIMITDPVAERKYKGLGDGAYEVGQALLCLSLGELYEGFAYKLIAAVIAPN